MDRYKFSRIYKLAESVYISINTNEKYKRTRNRILSTIARYIDLILFLSLLDALFTLVYSLFRSPRLTRNKQI